LSHYQPSAGGVIHGFSGSIEQAQQYWRLGFYLGVGGTITYERAKKTRRAIAGMPLESLLLETDAPDMPLDGFQGQPNTPLRLPRIAQCLAELRKAPLADIQKQTAQNTRTLFSLP
ncbi:TatD family hydrolase, partial [Pseudomaricurvus sp.]|uniref:TatD family hydrolase n=1 Tax=Pseudomaricurvus sp. TaxID=2004510 RepID=UPI003F6D8916